MKVWVFKALFILYGDEQYSLKTQKKNRDEVS